VTDAGSLPPAAVSRAFELDAAGIQLIPGGLINRSFMAIRAGKPVVLQAVSEIFGPRLQADLDVVTRHLAARGVLTPRLLPAADGQLTVVHGGQRWRLWRYVQGRTLERLESAPQAQAAGRLVAEFHRALLDLDHQFVSARLGVHDTAAHMARLTGALTRHAKHPEFARVQPLAEDILTRYARLPSVPATPDRIVHGDLKISNVVFDPDGATARCLIDLDTVGPMALPLELGDAMRSWCNRSTEDDSAATFSVEYLHAAMAGYASVGRAFITATEWRAILPATLMITVELAARFCADALHESYFAWDRARFSSASSHNQARARGQLALAASLQSQWEPAAAALAAVFSPPGGIESS
jgi:Ser/Thr protein kinase RdoA (MazF antagonist)